MSTSGSSATFDFIHEARTHLSNLLHGSKDNVSFNDKIWLKVHSKVNWVGHSNKLWISLGTSKWREQIYFDENSERILALKVKICEQAKGKTIPVILSLVNSLINELTEIKGEHYLITDSMLDNRMQELLSIHHQRQGTIVSLPIDYLIYKRILLCRHKALISAALLRELVEKKILPFGSVRQFRSTIQKDNQKALNHTWAVYRDSTTHHLWICDPRGQVACNVTTDFERLSPAYTKPALTSMMERLNKLDNIPSPPMPESALTPTGNTLLFTNAKSNQKDLPRIKTSPYNLRSKKRGK